MAVNAVLVMLGLLMGVLGGFGHSWYVGPVPASAFGCVALLFVIAYGAGRVTRGKAAALSFAMGWAAITMIWITGRPEGDLVIANDLSGYVYLYGGLAAVAMAVLLVPPAANSGSWLLTQHGYGPRPQASPAPPGPQVPPDQAPPGPQVPPDQAPPGPQVPPG
ncbi:DUF6113 family protein [Streptosporangium sp. NBC_01755]|uniref:DUF6113 family protein n=1 Tax=Streptosporangium sp. NBC_01755 TaxID=2975949 RepID=UPI002DDB8D1B|nr:DUF6113 family protein [Streptosporangium sp. NBC_01755]WSD02363.1 DUF6113 family protein [Streptosporangium sp. NBC_01755]